MVGDRSHVVFACAWMLVSLPSMELLHLRGTIPDELLEHRMREHCLLLREVAGKESKALRTSLSLSTY